MMKLLKINSQHRRDCYCDFVCEGCGVIEKNRSAYDDRNFWDNVVPDMKCKKCGKNAKELGSRLETIPTKYADYEVV